MLGFFYKLLNLIIIDVLNDSHSFALPYHSVQLIPELIAWLVYVRENFKAASISHTQKTRNYSIIAEN